MSLEQKIIVDLKEAMKSKDKLALRGIRAIKSAIMLLKTDGSGNEVTPEVEIKLLQKLVKQRKESADIYQEQGREDLAQVELDEISIIEKYLPEQLGEEEIKTIVGKLIADHGASGMKDMGRIMGIANKELAGKADGKTLAGVVRTLLNS